MASGITHILLTKKLQDEFPNGKLKDILAYCTDTFQIGAVAPDLPYASQLDTFLFLTNESPLADKFHYEKTNIIPLESLKIVKKLKSKLEEELHFHLFSFFLGYISHVIADGIIHPFVRDKVGEYEDNQDAHRTLEMQLDVLFMKELTKGSGSTSELNDTDIHNELENFNNNDASTEVLKIFSSLIESTYNEKYSIKKISGWVKGLHRAFSLAEGDDHPRLYKVLKINSYTFRNINDIDSHKAITLTKPIDRNTNFLGVDQIDFFKDCIPQYYRVFVSIAQKAFNYVYEDGVELTEKDMPLINLDTGRLANNNDLNLIPEFWKK